MLVVEPFPYQEQAIDMAVDRGNLLIAYGMGLGKTLVQIAISETLMETDGVTMSAIVVPASLKWQWAQAIAWATDVHRTTHRLKKQKIEIPVRSECIVIDGTAKKRDELYGMAREWRPDYVVLGYENVVQDWRQVKRLHPDLIALDEATAIKSFRSERSKTIKDWYADFRFALTGTPIDNRPEELYSIMEWVDPEELGRFDLFDKAYISRDGYGRMKRAKNLDILHAKTKTFMARKTRFDEDVAPFMPKAVEKQFYVSLSGKTKALYDKISKALIEDLYDIGGMASFDLEAYYKGESGGGTEAQGKAMAKFGALAMLCDHPLLLLESAEKFAEWWTSAVDGKTRNPEGSKFAYELLKEGHLDWITGTVTSPKFEAVLEQVHDILDEREANKVIIFSFSKKMLRLLKQRIEAFGTKAVIFDGDMNADQKEAAKQQFKTDPSTRVFLSSDAGGMGVDLPEANYLINYNHPWSAGKADQRNARHIRAGSRWEKVWVLDYVVSGSVEEWKYEVLGLKRKVGSAIIDGKGATAGVVENDVSSLLEWLGG